MECVNGCGRPAETRRTGGPSPRYCGDDCRRARKAKTHAKWLAANPDYNANYYAANRERELIRTAKRRALTKASRVEYDAKRRATSAYKERRRTFLRTPAGKASLARQNHDRKARERGAPRERVERHLVFERDGGLCGICGLAVDPDNWHLDHIIPLGPGEHTYENIRVAHPRCNRKKVTEDKRLLAEWRAAA